MIEKETQNRESFSDTNVNRFLSEKKSNSLDTLFLKNTKFPCYNSKFKKNVDLF